MIPREFELKVQAAIKAHEMLLPGDGALLGVSGGPDSTAMLKVLFALPEPWNLKLRIAHVNYGLRGLDSDGDEAFVRELAEKLGIAVDVLAKPDLESPALSGSMQMRARAVRLRFFEDLRKKHGLRRLALGHNLDDQVETALMRIIRGTSPDGLAGILPVQGNIIRPLRFLDRKEILQYLADTGQEFRTDQTNLFGKYLRNRIRNELLPFLRENFNPQVDAAIGRLSALAHGDRQYFDSILDLVSGALGPRPTPLGDLEIPLDMAAIESRAVLNRLILRILNRFPDPLRPFDSEPAGGALAPFSTMEPPERPWDSDTVDALADLIISGAPGRTIELANNLFAHRERERVVIGTPCPPMPKEPVSLPIPGAARLESLGFTLKAEKLDSIPELNELKNLPSNKIMADLDRIGAGALLIRRRKHGDRFHPFGVPGTQTLKEFFVDHKVPRWRRDSIPIIATARGEILWVGGLRMDERFRVTRDTKSVLALELISE